MNNFIKYIPHGEEHAVKLRDLVNLTGLSGREVYKAVESLRRQGNVICATDAGYFRPTNKDELRRYIRRANARVRSESILLHPARKLLKKWEAESHE